MFIVIVSFAIGWVISSKCTKRKAIKALEEAQKQVEQMRKQVQDMQKATDQLMSEVRAEISKQPEELTKDFCMVKFIDAEGQIHEVYGFDEAAMDEAVSHKDWRLFLG